MKKDTLLKKSVLHFRSLLSAFALLAFLTFGNNAFADDLNTGKGAGSSSTTSSTFGTVTDMSATVNLGTADADVTSVMVIVTFEVKVAGDNDKSEAYFQIKDITNTQTSNEIQRQLEKKATGGDAGIGSLVYIFDVSGYNGDVTYALQHRVDGDEITTAGTIVAIALGTSTGHVQLDNDMKSITTAVIAPTDWGTVTGLVTDAISLPASGSIFVAASLENLTSTGGEQTGTWRLQQRKGTAGSWENIGNEISRVISTNTDEGIASLGLMVTGLSSGDYYYQLQHKGPTGNVKTANTNLIAVALTYSTGTEMRTFPAFSKTVASDDVTSATLESALSQVGSPENTTDMFLYSQYNMSASAAVTSSYDISVTGSSSYSYSSQTQKRYVSSNTDIGSGASVGLASGLLENGDYTASVRHASDGSVTLTSSNIILSGFQTDDYVVSQSYASINIEDNTTNMISGTLSANTWRIISTFSELEVSPDWSLTANELIPTANAAGTYLIKYSASFTGSEGVYTVGVFKNDELVNELQSSRKISTAAGAGTDYGNISGNGFITISGTSDKISLKIMCDSDVTDITPKSAQLSLVEAVAGSGNHFAEMSINTPTTQVLTTAGTYYTLNGFTTGEVDGWTYSSNSLTAGSAGTYFVSANCSYNASEAASFDFRIENGTVSTGISFGRYISGSGDYGNAVGSGVITVEAGDVITLKTTSSVNGISVKPNYVGFTMTEISGTTPCYVANMDIVAGNNILDLVSGSWVQETHFDDGTLNQGWSFSPFPSGTLSQNDNTSAYYLVNYSVSFSYKDAGDIGTYIFPKLAIFIDNAQVEGSTVIRKLQTKDNGDVASASGTAIIPITSSTQIISLRASEKDNAEKSISILDANITLMSITGVDQSSIVVTGNSNTIEAGSTQPEASNNTYFGSSAVSSSLDKNFQIYNDGNIDLTGISASLSGTDASEFSLTTTPSGTVTSGSSTNLGVRFTPTSEGSKYATVSIASNDPDNNPFTFVIMGSTNGVKVWDGSESTVWETDANWTPSGAPTTSDDIRIPSSPANQPIVSSTSTGQCGDIFIESGASVTIQSTSAGTGSLIIDGEQTGDLTIQRYLAIDDYHYISSPIDYSNEMLHFADIHATTTSGDAPNMGLTVNGDDNFWRFLEEVAVGDGMWIDLLHTWSGHPTSRMELEMFRPAEGYAYCSHNSAATLKFEGVANNSDISYAVTYTDNGGDNGYHVIGNPFSSDIAVTTAGDATNNFINDNTALLDNNYEALYIWNEGSGSAWSGHYQAISNGGFTAGTANAEINQDFIELGQAFMVKVASVGDIVFNEELRKHGTADFYKNNAESWPGIMLTIEEQGEEMNDQSSTVITFYEGMTTSLDPSYDVGILKNEQLSLYSRLVVDNMVDFETQALPKDFTSDLIIPIGVDATECTEFKFTALIEEMGNYEMVLEDKLTEQMIPIEDISQDGYEVVVTENGVGRFYIHVKNVSAVGENELLGVSIYAYDKSIYVSSTEAENQELFIYDIGGRLMRTERISSGLEVIETTLPAGVYFVTTGGFTQKVVLL